MQKVLSRIHIRGGAPQRIRGFSNRQLTANFDRSNCERNRMLPSTTQLLRIKRSISIDETAFFCYLIFGETYGAVAHPGERRLCKAEAGGSSPPGSTNSHFSGLSSRCLSCTFWRRSRISTTSSLALIIDRTPSSQVPPSSMASTIFPARSSPIWHGMEPPSAGQAPRCWTPGARGITACRFSTSAPM